MGVSLKKTTPFDFSMDFGGVFFLYRAFFRFSPGSGSSSYIARSRPAR